MDMGVLANPVLEAPLPFNGWRGAREADRLDDVSGVVDEMSDIIPGHFAQLIIINSDIAGIDMRGGPAVDDDDRDAAIISFFDDGGQGFGFVGGDQEDVDVLVEQVLYLFDLELAVVHGAPVDEL